MICPDCEGKGTIEITYDEVWGSGRGMSNEEAMRKAGEVHHEEECERCGGTGELHRYLFIMSGIGSCAEEAFDNTDLELELVVDRVERSPGPGYEVYYGRKDWCMEIDLGTGEVLKDEMEE